MSLKQIEGYTIYLNQILGKGSYGNVYKGLRQENQEFVAVKIIPKQNIDSDEYMKNSLKNEIQILQSVGSEHIVGFYDVMESSKNYYIIQELCDGDLSEMIEPDKEFPQKLCVEILKHICSGFLALIREGIIHRDLKPANIMRKGKLFKIGDFGFSKQINSLQFKLNTTVGTPLYMPIEILQSMEYTSKCDIWALGFIFYEMLHGYTPWTGTREYQLASNLEKKPFLIKRKGLSKHTVDFLERSLRIYEKDRMSWDDIFKHPIFDGFFQDCADENDQFQNKLKVIMTKMRCYFNFNQQNLKKILKQYNYEDSKHELKFFEYFDFLKTINPQIKESQAHYIFKKTDRNNNGTISIEQILDQLKQHSINVSQIQSGTKSMSSLETIAEFKMIQCFKKLHKIIIKNKLSLKKVFNDFDKRKCGELNYNEFKYMFQKLSKDISDQDVQFAFKIIDDQMSDKITFDQLNKTYQISNGLDKQDNNTSLQVKKQEKQYKKIKGK